MITRRKKIIFRLLCLLVPLLMIEGIMYIKIWRRGKDLIPYEILGSRDIQSFEASLQQENAYIRYDPQLGWDVAPSGRKENWNDNKLHSFYQSNKQGIRAHREYSQMPEANRFRVVVLGDSFTHGDEVNLEETWSFQLEQRLGASWEVLNLGTPGYGTDQAVLKWEQKGLSFAPQVAILGIMTENICRVVNRFRPYYTGPQTGIPLTKPRFLLKSGQLTLAQPVTLSPETLLQGLKSGKTEFLVEHDFFYEASHYQDRWYYRSALLRYLCHNAIRHRWKQSHKISVLYQTPDVFDLWIAVIDRFVQHCQQHKIVPILVILYSKTDFEEKEPFWNPLIQKLQERKYPFLDLYPILQKNTDFTENRNAFFAENWHYNAQGNALIAQYLDDFLRAQEILKSYFPQ